PEISVRAELQEHVRISGPQIGKRSNRRLIVVESGCFDAVYRLVGSEQVGEPGIGERRTRDRVNAEQRPCGALVLQRNNPPEAISHATPARRSGRPSGQWLPPHLALWRCRTASGC